MAKLLNSAINTIYFGLQIALYIYNIKTNTSHRVVYIIII